MDMTLLIVDDEENILRRIEKYIRNNMTCFSEIYTAQNGEEALDIIFRFKPDVMLLDVQIPVKNGLEVMEEALEKGECPKTIILSGYDTFSYAQQALRLGAFDYLLKPCRSTEICERLRAALGIEETEEVKEKPAEKTESPVLRTAKKYIRDHLTENLSLTEVAEKAGVSTAYLSSLFSQHMGCGFVDYLNKARIDYATYYMENGEMKIYEIAFKAGFRDEKYFYRVFKKVTGQSPSEYRKSIGVNEK